MHIPYFENSIFFCIIVVAVKFIIIIATYNANDARFQLSFLFIAFARVQSIYIDNYDLPGCGECVYLRTRYKFESLSVFTSNKHKNVLT